MTTTDSDFFETTDDKGNGKGYENDHLRSLDGRHNEDFTPLYKLWTGENVFFCGGRIMLGHNPYRLPFTCVLILAVAVFDYFYLIPSVTQQDFHIVSVFVNVCFFVIVFSIYVTLAYVALTEPGIIPPSKLTYRVKLRSPSRPRTGVYLSVPNVMEGTTPGAHHRNQHLTYCVRCEIDRPERTRHCRYCNNCVDRFDHHCSWVANDIGARNYRSFLWFVSLLTLFCFFNVGFSIMEIVLKYRSSMGGQR